MASCTAVASLSCKSVYCGFRRANKVDGVNMRGSAVSFEQKTRYAKSGSRINCLQTSLIISLCTASALSIGRFVFLPFQREQIAKAGLPLQNGVSHYEAGDTRAQEVSSLLKTNDPAGFTIVDVLAWGSIGHIVAYWILALPAMDMSLSSECSSVYSILYMLCHYTHVHVMCVCMCVWISYHRIPAAYIDEYEVP